MRELREKLTCLISSCENYSDLWDIHVSLLNKNWSDRGIDTYIVTDKKHVANYEDIKIFAAGDNKEMPQRIKEILPEISTEYVFLTLDDYFLTEQIDTGCIKRIVTIMDELKLDYVRLFPYPHSKKKIDGCKKIYWIDLVGNYQVNLYPGIWRKSFLEKTFKESLSAWKYEVSLTKIAKDNDARCALSLGNEFPFLDVIRKGKILHKAKRFLDKNGYSLNRDVISRKQEIKLNIMFYGKEIIPKPILRVIKKKLIKRGHAFFSEGI